MSSKQWLPVLLSSVISLGIAPVHPGDSPTGSNRPASDTKAPAPADASAVRALLDKGRYAEAESQARELLSEASSRAAMDSPEALEALQLLVESLWRGGKTKAPETLHLAQRSVQLAGQLSGEDSLVAAGSLAGLGNVQFWRGELAEARATHQRALAIREAKLPSGDSDIARSLDDLGRVEDALGHVGEASATLRRALDLQEKVSAESLDVAITLSDLARVMKKLGDFAGAKSVLEKALAIREKSLAPDHPSLAEAKTNLASILIQLNDFSGAERLARETLTGVEKSLGSEHPQVVSALTALGQSLYYQGKTAQAAPYFKRALDLCRKIYGEEHPTTALTYRRLGKALLDTEGPGAGKKLIEQALAIQQKVFGPENLALTETHETLGDVLMLMGDFESAEMHLRRALAILETAYGPSHIEESDVLLSLAGVALARGNSSAALEASLSAERILRENLERIARTLSEEEALQNEERRISGLDYAISALLARAEKPLPADAAARVFDAVIRSRAMVLDEIASRHMAITRSSEPSTGPLRESLARAREEVVRTMLRETSFPDPKQYSEALAAAVDARERAERQLAEASAAFRQELQVDRAGLAEVAEALPRDSALVAYLRTDRIEWRRDSKPGPPVATHTSTYVAFVLRAGGTVKIHSLASAAEIEKLAKGWRSLATVPPRGLTGSNATMDESLAKAGTSLRKAVWDPLLSALGDARQVLMVPDGVLNLVNLGALPGQRDRFLLESSVPQRLLVTERELLKSSSANPRWEGALVLGDPDFDHLPGKASQSEAVRQEGGAAGKPTHAADNLSHRGPSCGGFGSVRFDALPASFSEASEVAALVDRRLKPQDRGAGSSTLLTGAAATESAFKRLAPGKSLLHLATHGFFLGEACEPPPPPSVAGALPSGLSVELATIRVDGPLLLSGLVFAGANRRDAAGREIDDGILTAEEISSLDLSQVDLAVLSACETGIGKIQSGEGVLGLRRAFDVAGVGALVVSLWKVQDESTREWMKLFYEGKVKGLPAWQALREASLQMLAARRAKGKSTHPFFWGGFVVTGEGR
jgi:tetratricopeptide (TPR) repeat protein